MKNQGVYRVIEIIAALFILLFTYTAISKWVDGNIFYSTLTKSPLVRDWASIISWMLPAVELITVILLFIPAIRWAGLYLSLALMLIFTSYIAFMLFSSYDLPCSCGGVLKNLSWKDHLIMNIILTMLAALAVILEIRRWKPLNKVS